MNYLCYLMITLLLVACSNNPQSESNTTDTFNPADTIPTIITAQKDLAYPSIFEASFDTGTVIHQWGETFSFYKKSIGNLTLSSGQLVAIDPIVLQEAEPFIHQFPIGTFPVELAIAKFADDEIVGFVRIQFNNNPIQTWEYALHEGNEPMPLNSQEMYGYSVDGAMGMFIDLEGANYLNQLENEAYWKEIFATELFTQNQSPWSYANHSSEQHHLVAFSTGFGDGFYGTFIGLDQAGNISQVLTDFGLINWWLLPSKEHTGIK